MKEPVRLAGFNWVADDRSTGNTLPAWRFKEDIDRMKSLGANMARLSHRTLPEEVLDYLDVGIPSEWSEMLTATPGTKAMTGEAKIKGILQQNGEFVLSCSPAKNASGYKITYETDGKQVKELINQSEIE